MNTDITVTTWNIQYGIDVTGSIETLRSHDRLASTDVLLLQEMDEGGVARIADALEAGYVYERASVHRATGRDFGNAIVSRLPFVSAGRVALPHRSMLRGEPRASVHATVSTGSTQIHVVSVHTEVATLPLRYRRRQFDALAAATPQAVPLIIGGDFNTVTRRGVRELHLALEPLEVSPVVPAGQTTYRRAGLAVPLDHLFIRSFKMMECGVVGSSASDHLPMWARLSLDQSTAYDKYLRT